MSTGLTSTHYETSRHGFSGVDQPSAEFLTMQIKALDCLVCIGSVLVVRFILKALFGAHLFSTGVVCNNNKFLLERAKTIPVERTGNCYKT